EQYAVLPEATARRLCRAYGTRMERLLGEARSVEDLGRGFGTDLTEAEVEYLMRFEWARRAADVAWRRSKLGLRLSAEELEALDALMIKRAETLVMRTS